MNGCSQEKLDAGDFVYFDPVHGTDALYREIGRLGGVHEIDAFMDLGSVRNRGTGLDGPFPRRQERHISGSC